MENVNLLEGDWYIGRVYVKIRNDIHEIKLITTIK